MAKQFDIQTNIGNIPSGDEFQNVKQVFTDGKTGEEMKEPSNKYSDVVNSVKGLFAEHSEKLFSIIALIGFTLVFYAGRINDWEDFKRYSAFLIVVLFFYLILSLGHSPKNHK